MNIWGLILLSVSYSLVEAFQSSDERLVKGLLSDFYDFDEEKDNFSDAVKNLQNSVGLNEDGKVSKELLAHLSKPRCGVKDNNKKSKRYVLTKDKWESGITYRHFIHENILPRGMRVGNIYRAVDIGISYWSKVVEIDFSRSSTKRGSMFSFSFARYYHAYYDVHNNFVETQCVTPLDNVPLMFLAHATVPRGGNIHFDSSETWTENTDKGVNLRLTAAHEMGHAIGLSHSKEPKALMNSNYGGYTSEKEFQLHPDDVEGIRQIYKPRGTSRIVRSANKTKEFSKNKKELCQSKNFPSVFQFSDGHVYVASDNGKVYRMIGKKVDGDFKPTTLNKKLIDADAIFFDKSAKRLIVFKGKNVFSAQGKTLDKLTVKKLKVVHQGAFQGRVDAAFVRDEVKKSSKQRFWAIQDGKFVSGSIKGDKVIFSRRTTRFSDLLKMSTGAEVPSSIDGALMIGKKDKVRLILFIGNSIYVGSPTGRKNTKFNIPAQYPITIKQVIDC